MSVLAGLTPELWRAAVVVFLFGLWLSSRDLPWRWALPVTALKVAIPLVYFAVDPAGHWHVSDGLDYHHDALMLLRQGYGPLHVFTDPFAYLQFREAAGGLHMAYPLWNLVALSWLGPHYFSPVFLNVGLTFAAGWLFVRMVRAAGFGPEYSLPALVFFLLHIDLLTWTSLLNLKDVWVMTLSLAVLVPALSARSRLFWRLPLLVAALILLAFLRFYAPLLLLTAVAVWTAATGAGRGRYVAVACAAGGVITLGLWQRAGIMRAWAELDFASIPFGVLRFLITPLPWKLTPDYGFLLAPATFHVLLLLPALLAIPALWRRSRAARLPLLYLAVVILFYAAVPALQGSRQRLQTSFVFAWLQFHALWTLARYAVPEAFGAARGGPGGEGAGPTAASVSRSPTP